MACRSAATLSDGVNLFTASTGNTRVDVSGWNLSNLSVTPPTNSGQDFTLTVLATATESANAHIATNSNAILIEVAAVADLPTLTVPATVTMDEDTQSGAFSISAALVDTDASETLQLEISGVPIGTVLTDGSNTFEATAGSTTVDVTDWNLTTLSVIPLADSDVDFVLGVTATATEAENGDQATRSDSISVQVTAVADQPALTVPATVSILEANSSAAFSIAASLADTDGSETLLVVVSDIPDGVALSDGNQTFVASSSNNSLDVTNWDLANLTITPVAGSDADFVLTVTATATEAENNDQNVATDSIHVDITAVADQPTLTVPATVTVAEDTQSAAFAISSTLTDTDGSETLTLVISDVPAGTQLSDGFHLFTATHLNSAVDITGWSLANLTVTPAANSDVDFALTVTATATETANGDQSSRVDTINVEVDGRR